MRSRFSRLFATLSLAVLCGSAVSANTGVTVTLDPPAPLGVGDDTNVVINSKPGDLPFILWSNFAGPTTLPLVGTLNIGTPLFIIPLPQIPTSGTLSYPCPIPCSFVGPVYMYVVMIDPAPPAMITGVSNQIVISVDQSVVDDCNGNLVDDDCELETGAPDCDNNGVIDDCEADCDQNGTPDACETFEDCDGNNVPDQCQPDCDANGTPDACEDDCDNDGTPDSCEDDCDNDGIPDDCEVCADSLFVLWAMQDCVAGTDADFFDELTSANTGDCSNTVVIGSTLSGDEHSCSNDAVTDLGGQSICLIARPQTDFDVSDPKTLRFSVTVTENAGGTARLNELSLWTLAPVVGLVSTPTSESMFANCPPQFYGIRILRDGVEVYLNDTISLVDMWRFDSFDLSTDANFLVTNATAIFDFEILAYAPACATNFRVWDLDEIKVDVCCDAIGGTVPNGPSCP